MHNKYREFFVEDKNHNIFVPRRIEDRLNKYLQQYVKNGCKGNLDLNGKNLTELPEILKHVEAINGSFDCSNNKLKSLKNCPSVIKGPFDCSNNNLITLKGAPVTVQGDFWCHRNELTSLEGCPDPVGGDFACSNNKLTSLKGCPDIIYGRFYCNDNQLTSLEGMPRKIYSYMNCGNNPVRFSKEYIYSLSHVKGGVYY